MDTARTLEVDLRALDRLWEQLTAGQDQPKTTLAVLEDGFEGRQTTQEYVTRFLAYALDPSESHGLDTALLRAVLTGLPPACGFHEDVHDLSDVRVETGMPVTARVDGTTASAETVDLVVAVPNEWLVLIECGFGTPDGHTEFLYRDATHVAGTPFADFASGAYHVYLHRTDRPTANEPAFANWTWTALVQDVLQPFLIEHAAGYPNRTVTQLRAFIDDLRTIAGMTDSQDDTDEKVALYLDHYEAITDVTAAFDRRWEAFTDEWGARLGERLELEGVGTVQEAGTNIVRFELTSDTGDRSDWLFRTSSDDWGMIFKYGWWRHTDALDSILTARAEDRNDVRIGFHHRLERNRDLAVGDRTLEVYFRVMGANDQAFIDRFTEAFGAREADITAALPETAELTGDQRNRIVATYDIDVGPHANFFDAYTGALSKAFIDLVGDNPALVSVLDECYGDTIADVYGTSLSIETE